MRYLLAVLLLLPLLSFGQSDTCTSYTQDDSLTYVDELGTFTARSFILQRRHRANACKDSAGTIYFNPSDSAVYLFNGSDTIKIGGAGAGSGTVQSITAASPLTGGTITISGSIGIQTASGSQSGAISSADWNTFNGKQAALGYTPLNAADSVNFFPKRDSNTNGQAETYYHARTTYEPKLPSGTSGYILYATSATGKVWATPPTSVGSLESSNGSIVLDPLSGTGSLVDAIIDSHNYYNSRQLDSAILAKGYHSGTVTTVTVNPTNGVTATVTNPTTTPIINIGLGAITPTSVNASGTVAGSNLSGANTGDQTITLTGEVTGSGTGSFAATINKALTYTWTGPHTFTSSSGTVFNVSALATSPTPGIVLQNTTAATNAVKAQYSPLFQMLGTHWNGSASVTEGWDFKVTSSANNVARPTLAFRYTVDGSTFTDWFSMNPVNGTSSLSGSLSLASGLSVAAGGVTATLGDIQAVSGSLFGIVPVTDLNSGTGATSTTFWRGDGTWATPAGTGVSSVVAGTNIAVSGTTVPTVSVTGTIAVANGGTGTTATTSVNTTPVTLGSDNTVTASANTLTTTTLNPTVVNSSLTKVGTVTSGTWSATIGSSATATTQAIDDNSTKVATTAYVQLYIPSDTSIAASYTLTSRDLYRTIHSTAGSGITVTIPTSLGTRFNCTVIEEAAGQVTFSASGTTLTYIPTATTKTKQSGSIATIRSWAAANSFTVQGDLN